MFLFFYDTSLFKGDSLEMSITSFQLGLPWGELVRRQLGRGECDHAVAITFIIHPFQFRVTAYCVWLVCNIIMYSANSAKCV